MIDEKFIAPDLVAPVRAWRFWRLVGKGSSREMFLSSVVKEGLVWPERERMNAVCFPGERFCRGKHAPEEVPPPAPSDSRNLYTLAAQCGIYGYKTPTIAISDYRGELVGNQIISPFYRGGLLGEVNLWGRVQKHKYGYRAEYAYPFSLAMGICADCGEPFFLDSESLPFRSQTLEEGGNLLLLLLCQLHNFGNVIPNGLTRLAERYGLEINLRIRSIVIG